MSLETAVMASERETGLCAVVNLQVLKPESFSSGKTVSAGYVSAEFLRQPAYTICLFQSL